MNQDFVLLLLCLKFEMSPSARLAVMKALEPLGSSGLVEGVLKGSKALLVLVYSVM